MPENCFKSLAAPDPVPFVWSSGKSLVIVKWDRFYGESIATLARERIGCSDVLLWNNAAGALRSLRSRPADIGIFGLTLPDMDGLDLLGFVSRERLVRRSIVVMWRTDERARQLLKKIGPHFLVETRYQGPGELMKALKWASDFGMGVSSVSRRKRGLVSGQPSIEQMFSERELHVLSVLADGSDDQESADLLGLSRHTVHTYRQRIMSKLEVKTRAELIREALLRGVIRFTENGALRPGLHGEFADRGS